MGPVVASAAAPAAAFLKNPRRSTEVFLDFMAISPGVVATASLLLTLHQNDYGRVSRRRGLPQCADSEGRKSRVGRDEREVFRQALRGQRTIERIFMNVGDRGDRRNHHTTVEGH